MTAEAIDPKFSEATKYGEDHLSLMAPDSEVPLGHSEEERDRCHLEYFPGRGGKSAAKTFVRPGRSGMAGKAIIWLNPAGGMASLRMRGAGADLFILFFSLAANDFLGRPFGQWNLLPSRFMVTSTG